MPTTPRLLLPYPDQNSNPFFAVFQAMVLAIDASLYTPREDRNILIFGGGTMSFSASSGVLTWSAPVNLFASVTGHNWIIPTGNVVLQDGELFYITVARAPQSNTTYTPKVGAFTPNQPNGDNQILIGLRVGSVVHFRDGFTIASGQSLVVFDSVTVTAPPTGPIYPRGLTNAGPAGTYAPPYGANPIGSLYTSASSGLANLVYDPLTFTRGQTTFGPFVWGVRTGLSYGGGPTFNPLPAAVFRWDITNNLYDVVELNDISAGAVVANESPCQGDVVVDNAGNAWTIEKTSNTLVQIQHEPPQVIATFPIPNSNKNLLAYDSVNHALILLGTGSLARFLLASSTFTADVPFFGTTGGPESVGSIYYSPVAGAPNGGYLFVGTYDSEYPGGLVYQVDPVSLANLASVGPNSHLNPPTGYVLVPNSGTPKLFVSGNSAYIFRVDVSSMTIDTSHSFSEAELAGLAVSASVTPFATPRDLHFNSSSGLVWVADTLNASLVAFNASTQAVEKVVDLSGIAGWTGARRIIGDGTNLYVSDAVSASPLVAIISETSGAIVGLCDTGGGSNPVRDQATDGGDNLYAVRRNGATSTIHRFSISAAIAAYPTPVTHVAVTATPRGYHVVAYDPLGLGGSASCVYGGTFNGSPPNELYQLNPTTLAEISNQSYSSGSFTHFQGLLVAFGSVWASSFNAEVLRFNHTTFPSAPVVISTSLTGASGLSADTTSSTILVGDDLSALVSRIDTGGNSEASTFSHGSGAFATSAVRTPTSIWTTYIPNGFSPVGDLKLFTTTVGSESFINSIAGFTGTGFILWAANLAGPSIYRILNSTSSFTPNASITLSSVSIGDSNSVVADPVSNQLLVVSDSLDEIYALSTSGSINNVCDFAGITTAIPPGANGQVLTTRGPGGTPYWATPSSGVGSVTGSSPIASSGGANPNITFSIAGQTEGDLVYFDGTNWVRLPAGTSGYVLTTQGSSSPPLWAIPSTMLIVEQSGTPIAGNPFTTLSFQGITATNGGGGVAFITADAVDYPDLPGTGTNQYALNGYLGTIAEVVPTQISLAYGTDNEVDTFVAAVASSVPFSYYTIAHVLLPLLDGSTPSMGSYAMNVSLTVVGRDTGGAGTGLYSADLSFSAIWNGSYPAILLQPGTNPSNVLTSGTANPSGTTASITASAGPTITLTGLTNMTPAMVGLNIMVSGAASGVNNGGFPIATYISPTSVTITNPSGVTDANNGAIVWSVANWFCLATVALDNHILVYVGGVGTVPQGTAASITVGGGNVTLTGLNFMCVEQFPFGQITISGAATPANNGTFPLASLISPTSVTITNGSAATDANNGSIVWTATLGPVAWSATGTVQKV